MSDTQGLSAEQIAAQNAQAAQSAELAAARRELESAKAQAAEYQNQMKLISDEKAQALATSAAETEKFKMTAARERLRNEAVRAGLVNPSLVDHLPAADLKVDASGAILGVPETIAQWQKNTPEIFTKTVSASDAAAAAAAAAAGVRIPAASAAIVSSTGSTAPVVDAMKLPRTKEGRAEYAKLRAETLEESHRIAGLGSRH